MLQPYVKQLGQRALSPDFDVDFAYVEDAMAAAPAVTFQTTINKLAGALEGGLNELLVAIWQAIMLKKPFLTAKVFLGAYLLSWLGARLDVSAQPNPFASQLPHLDEAFPGRAFAANSFITLTQ